MTTEHVLVIGGSSGLGLALAGLLLSGGAEVTIASRSAERLTAAAAHLCAGPNQLRTQVLDIRDEDGVRRALEASIPVHHIAVTAADAARATGPLGDFHLADARAVMDAKFFGPWLVGKHAASHLPPTGSITLTSGIPAHRPRPGSSVTAAANAAVEGLVGALALELAPIRVNAVSPGWMDTPLWDTIAGNRRAERLGEMAARLPVGRVARPTDVAEAFVTLMGSGHITGTVLHVDGGQRLV
jgi:NAD(P)-dependent dehydrogenase (short-subunit alcohol dehydrogenase family)